MAPEQPAKDGLGPARPGLVVLAFAAFAAVTTEMLPMGLLPAISSSFGTSESRTGQIVSLYAIVVALGAVPVTIATRRLPGKLLLLITTIAYAVSNLLSALAPTLDVLAAARLLGGATHALFFSLVIGYAARLVPAAQSGRALALASTGASGGFILGVPLATAVGNAVGWRGAFGILVALMLATTALIVVFLPDARTANEPKPATPGRKRDLAAVVATNTLAYLGQYSLYTYVSVLLLASGIPIAWVAPALFAFGVAGLLGIGIAARHLDLRPRRSALVIIGAIGAGLAGVAVGVPSMVLVLLAGVVWCGAFGPAPSLFQSAAVRARAVSPEIAGAWVNSTANAGIAGGALIGGLVLDASGISQVAWTGAALLGLTLLAVLAWRRAFPTRSSEFEVDRGRADAVSAGDLTP